MKILIDNGHGINTPGKRSPDGTLREYALTRRLATRIVDRLTALHHDAALLVPEETDIPLAERCRRTNGHCARLGAHNICLVSIHINAAGDGTRWTDARGWSAYTTRGTTQADTLANHLYEAAKHNLPGHHLRTDPTDGDPDLEAGFYLLRHTRCAAVLTENLFMDNPADCAFLLTPEGQQSLIDLHIDGITSYLTTI